MPLWRVWALLLGATGNRIRHTAADMRGCERTMSPLSSSPSSVSSRYLPCPRGVLRHAVGLHAAPCMRPGVSQPRAIQSGLLAIRVQCTACDRQQRVHQHGRLLHSMLPVPVTQRRTRSGPRSRRPARPGPRLASALPASPPACMSPFSHLPTSKLGA